MIIKYVEFKIIAVGIFIKITNAIKALLRILAGKKHPKNKFQRLRKNANM